MRQRSRFDAAMKLRMTSSPMAALLAVMLIAVGAYLYLTAAPGASQVAATVLVGRR